MTDSSGNVAFSPEAEHSILSGRSFDDFYLFKQAHGSSNVIVVFAGEAQSFGVSLALLLRILKRFDCHIVFLQDSRKQYYLHGVLGLGGTYSATLEALKDRVAGIGARNIYCLGQSGGGYASVQFAIDLQAQGVLTFVPATTLETLEQDGTLPATGADTLPQPLDLRVQLGRAEFAPHISIVYGELSEQDSGQAKRLDHPAVELIPLEGVAEHTVFSRVVAEDRLDGLIAKLFASSRHGAGAREGTEG